GLAIWRSSELTHLLLAIFKVIAVSAWITASSLPVAPAAAVPAPAPTAVPIRAPLPSPASLPMAALIETFVAEISIGLRPLEPACECRLGTARNQDLPFLPSP